MNGTKTIIRYWKVGKLLHVVAILAFFMALQSYFVLQDLDANISYSLWIMWLLIFICFFNMSVLAELDGYSRFQNYKQIKDQIYLNGYQDRLLKPLSKSSCQRAAAILASEELGVRDSTAKYFYVKGYRWYHVIPDFLFRDPLLFFTPFFWRTTFFAPYYKSKVDYENLRLTLNNIIVLKEEKSIL